MIKYKYLTSSNFFISLVASRRSQSNFFSSLPSPRGILSFFAFARSSEHVHVSYITNWKLNTYLSRYVYGARRTIINLRMRDERAKIEAAAKKKVFCAPRRVFRFHNCRGSLSVIIIERNYLNSSNKMLLSEPSIICAIVEIIFRRSHERARSFD